MGAGPIELGESHSSVACGEISLLPCVGHIHSTRFGVILRFLANGFVYPTGSVRYTYQHKTSLCGCCTDFGIPVRSVVRGHTGHGMGPYAP